MNDAALNATLDTIHTDLRRPSAPPELHERVLAVPYVVPRKRRAISLPDRFGSMFGATKFAVAGAVVALFGGLLPAGVLQPSQDPAHVTGSSPSASSPPSVAVEPVLVWEEVELDFTPADPYNLRIDTEAGKFGMNDDEGLVHESADGLAWKPLEPEQAASDRRQTNLRFGDRRVLHRQESATVTIEAPDGSRTGRTFRGPLHDVVVSPAGIVVIENVRREHVIEDVLGPEVAAGDWRVVDVEEVKDPERPDWGDRVRWRVRTPDGKRVKLRLARHGYGGVARDDHHIATLGWHSPDGIEWVPIRSATLSYDDGLIGTDQGFWRRHGVDPPKSLWFSADGTTWTRLGRLTGFEMHPWRDGVLVQNGGTIRFATRAGMQTLGLPEVIDDLGLMVDAAGPYGIVWLDRDTGQVVFSPDGEMWGLADMPPEWLEPDVMVQEAIVGEEAVIVRVDRCDDPSVDLRECYEEAGAIETRIWRGALKAGP